MVRLCWCFPLLSFIVAVEAAPKCERLKASLTYPQDEAPRDLSGVVGVVSIHQSTVHATPILLLILCNA